jgi:hypothetical protein
MPARWLRYIKSQTNGTAGAVPYCSILTKACICAAASPRADDMSRCCPPSQPTARPYNWPAPMMVPLSQQGACCTPAQPCTSAVDRMPESRRECHTRSVRGNSPPPITSAGTGPGQGQRLLQSENKKGGSWCWRCACALEECHLSTIFQDALRCVPQAYSATSGMSNSDTQHGNWFLTL